MLYVIGTHFSSQLNFILASFLHVVTQISLIFPCEYTLALNKFMRYDLLARSAG